MDLSGIEACPVKISINLGAREKNILPSPPILKFLIYGPIFMKLDI